eukprot:CAMPEP_0198535012 /NCGR_PEP_ID=MMETSP1462-20131121/37629_1 /TAXON_ID=1333877 /ORGANISM="Brandtodinium nutriculum, Strain RCC3387" /LENGTH=34 /DNA_ID= /DNA_START= /DNA_END= /DNA_ORIENTATION=
MKGTSTGYPKKENKRAGVLYQLFPSTGDHVGPTT